ncbi:MAG: alkaline phosphatase family protein, partial [Synechocystis sp.]|nr:alkaline phosphatase family protein [Synechocystis sp.]
MAQQKSRVLAIGLDACEPSLLEQWIDQGLLPNLASLKAKGIYQKLENFKDSNVETAWTSFCTGCSPQKTGYWAALGFQEGTYETETYQAYDFQEFPPFMALGDDYRVAIFDVPQLRLNQNIHGVQVGGWGAHSPQVPSQSSPPEFFQEVIDKHGNHPGLHNDYSVCLDLEKTLSLEEKFITGIQRKAKICCDLLQQQDWDLLLTVFGEPHGGGHVFWQLSQPDHPLYESLKSQVDHDPLLAIYQAVDQAIAEMIAVIPDDMQVVLFAAHGMGFATIDLPTFVILPEFLYRFNFPGKWALGYGNIADPLPPLWTHMKGNWWERHIWGTQFEPNPIKRFLRSEIPSRLFRMIRPWLDQNNATGLRFGDDLAKQGVKETPWMPAQWYQPLWPSMKAFALPSFSEGYVRINLKGREPQGIVDPADYHTLCDELEAKLYALREPRTDIPLVDHIVRPRQDPLDRNPKLPDADLIVVWQEKYPTDVADSPDYGRIGPFPPYRAGSHRAEGFILATGSAI